MIYTVLHNQGYLFHNQWYILHNHGYIFHKQWYILHNQGYVFHHQWYILHNQGCLFYNQGSLFRSLKKREWVNRTYKKHAKNTILVNFFFSKSLMCSFIMSDLSKLLMMAHLLWVTWAIRARLLFWHEWPDQFARSCSFVLSDLSKSLTVAHLIWSIWVNEQMSKWAMSKWAYSQPCKTTYLLWRPFYQENISI